MTELDHALLDMFSAELLEHVTVCEQVLARAGSDPVDEHDLHLVLRSLHSVKGLARVVASSGLERLAHAAESVVALAREGKRPLDAPAQDVLLRALDACKEARERIVAGAEFIASDALLRRLGGMQAAARATETSTPRSEAPEASSDSDADAVESAADGDLYFDQGSLVALAELLEELLPAIAMAVASEDAPPSAEALENIDALQFALEKLKLDALARAVRALEDRSSPAAFARCLCLVERLGHVLERDCGMAEALRLSRPWLAEEVSGALRGQRWSDVDWLLRAVLPQSALVGLLPQILSASCPREARSAALRVFAQAVPMEIAPGGAPSTDMATLAADRVRELLYEPHQVTAAALMALDARRLDLERFRALPLALVGRVQSVALDPELELFEVVLAPKDATGDLSDLARSLNAGLEPLLAETIAVANSAPTLVLLVASREREERLRVRVAEIAGERAEVTTRKLDQQPGDAHFRVHARPAAEPSAASDTQVRVPVALLDSMFGRIGHFFSITTRFNALVFDSDVKDILSELSDYSVLRAPHLLPKIDRLVRQQNEYATIEAETHRLITLIHEMTLGLRVIPMDTLFNRFPRMVRDLAQKQGKQVRFDARSNGIRVDNGMIELLADPLMHMVRNCIDHGIEPPDARDKAAKPRTATLVLNAEQRGNHVVIEVGDDGRGIDLERVLEKAIERNLVDAANADALTEEAIAHLIFSPGFSTAERVTPTSGRGVGMDVALVNVTKLGGVIDIITQRGRGTTFRIDIPLSKAIQSMLLAETGVQTVAFPDRMVLECVVAHASDVQSVNGQRSILHHDRFLPLFGLVELLKLPAPQREGEDGELSIVVCELDGRRVGFEVHRIRRRTDLLVQEMHPRIAKLPGIGGISTIGTDKIVIVVDPEGLFDLARRNAVFGLRTHAVRVAEELF